MSVERHKPMRHQICSLSGYRRICEVISVVMRDDAFGKGVEANVQ
jgi:hypothetical protein